MTTFGIALVWCAMQVTIVTLIAIVADMLLKRRGRAGGSTTLILGLIGALALTAFVWSPWPRWSWEVDPSVEEAGPSPVTNDDEAETTPLAANTTPAEGPSNVTAPPDAIPSTEETVTTTESGWDFSGFTMGANEVWQSFQNELERASIVAEQPHPPMWPLWVGSIIASGIAISLMRLILGWRTIQKDRQSSRPIESPQLSELCDLLRAELSIARSVELRESPHMATAATIGWRKPLILLPLDWRTWEAAELRAVLAHELGHISRRHFPAWIAAQVALAFHFYHPLMHWIVGRLRLAQELEADEDAALVNGGRRSYLESLAALAIRQADVPVSWPARAFLPTRKTFMRRIEMLRSNRPLRAPSAVMSFIACGLVLAGVTFAAGVRDGVSDSDTETASGVQQSGSSEQDPVTGTPIGLPGPPQLVVVQPGQRQPAVGGPGPGIASDSASDGAITLSHIPGDAVVVAAIRPAKLLESLEGNEDFAPVLAMLQGEDPKAQLIARIEQVTLTLSAANLGQAGPNPPLAITLRFAEAGDLEAFWETVPAGQQTSFANASYRGGPGGECFWQIDDRTVLIGSEAIVQESILRGARVRSDLVEGAVWESNAGSAHALVAVDVAYLAGMMPPDMKSAVMAPFSPIWEETELLTVALTLEGSSLNTTATLDCTTEEGAVTVQETLDAVMVLARNAMSGLQRQMAQPGAFGPSPSEEFGLVWGNILAMQEAFFESLEVTAEGSAVTLTSAYEVDPALFALFATRTSMMRAQAANARQQNNLRQIGIALHTYYDVNGHFPPATIIDEESGEARSWRVEILPYIEQGQLYESYRKDEPWDSEHNLRILEQMPPTYAPLIQSTDEALSSHTGILAIVGEGTGFAAEGEGLQFQEFIDGTSNTLLVVDSPGELVPWTKPDDLEVTITGDEIDLGGLAGVEFQTLFCDGSVRAIPADTPPSALIILMGRAEGLPTPTIGNVEVYPAPTVEFGFGAPQYAEPAATEAIRVAPPEEVPADEAPETVEPPRPPQ